MTRGVGAIASYGTLVTPHYILDDTQRASATQTVNIPKEYFDIVHEGMRKGVLEGTSSLLNVPYVKIASKTGTAQLGISNSRVNSWIIGFFPYDNPKYAYTIMMESGPATNGVGAPFIMRGLIDWMSQNTPEYFQ